MEKKSKKLEPKYPFGEDKTIGVCPFREMGYCLARCVFHRENQNNTTYCVLARASDKIIEKAEY
jgi:hypothetical protein